MKDKILNKAKRKFNFWFRRHWEIFPLDDSGFSYIETSEWKKSLEEAYLAGYKSGQRKDSKQSKDTVNK